MTNKNKPKIYVTNKSAHDFSQALDYGELVFMSEGKISRYATTHIVRTFAPFIKDSDPQDYILITSLSVMSALACSLFAVKHKCLNLMIFSPREGGKYEVRKLDFREIFESQE